MRRAAETIRAFVAISHFDAADRAIALLTSWNETDGVDPGHLHDAILEHSRGLRAYFALDYPLAREHLERARATFEALGATGDLHGILFDISGTYFYEDRFAEAKRYIAYVEQPIADSLAHARGHHRLAEIAAMRGDLAGAIEHQKRSLAINGAADVYFTLVCEATLAEYYLANDDVAEAAAAVERGAPRPRRSAGKSGAAISATRSQRSTPFVALHGGARAQPREARGDRGARGQVAHDLRAFAADALLDRARRRPRARRFRARVHRCVHGGATRRSVHVVVRAELRDAFASQGRRRPRRSAHHAPRRPHEAIELAFDEEQEPITEDEATR